MKKLPSVGDVVTVKKSAGKDGVTHSITNKPFIGKLCKVTKISKDPLETYVVHLYCPEVNKSNWFSLAELKKIKLD